MTRSADVFSFAIVMWEVLTWGKWRTANQQHVDQSENVSRAIVGQNLVLPEV